MKTIFSDKKIKIKYFKKEREREKGPCVLGIEDAGYRSF